MLGFLFFFGPLYLNSCLVKLIRDKDTCSISSIYGGWGGGKGRSRDLGECKKELTFKCCRKTPQEAGSEDLHEASSLEKAPWMPAVGK